MPNRLHRTLIIGFIVAGFWSPSMDAGEPLLQEGDRIAIAGAGIVEAMQVVGSFEQSLQLASAKGNAPAKISLRNLGWSGDNVKGRSRAVFDGPSAPEKGLQRLLTDIETSKATLVLLAYGQTEATQGIEYIETEFASDLEKLIALVQSEQRRVALVLPISVPGIRLPNYAASLSRVRRIMRQAAEKHSLGCIDIPADVVPSDEWEDGGMLPNDAGMSTLAVAWASNLLQQKQAAQEAPLLRRKIVAKNRNFFHRYRPQNETYLFLFRKHEQGQNAKEVPQFDPLVEEADQQIWQATVQFIHR